MGNQITFLVCTKIIVCEEQVGLKASRVWVSTTFTSQPTRHSQTLRRMETLCFWTKATCSSSNIRWISNKKLGAIRKSEPKTIQWCWTKVKTSHCKTETCFTTQITPKTSSTSLTLRWGTTNHKFCPTTDKSKALKSSDKELMAWAGRLAKMPTTVLQIIKGIAGSRTSQWVELSNSLGIHSK